MDVGCFCELLADLSAKEETLLDLDRGIEQGIATDDLVAEITNTEEYKERVSRLGNIMAQIHFNEFR